MALFGLTLSRNLLVSATASAVLVAGTAVTLTRPNADAQAETGGTAPSALMNAATSLFLRNNPVPKPTPTPPAGRPLGSQKLGLNLGSAAYWSGERDFMNLVMGDQWRQVINGRWVGAMDAARIDPVTGTPRSLASGESAVVVLTPPVARSTPYQIRCTWTGTGRVSIGNIRNVTQGDRQLEFSWNVPVFSQNPQAWLSIDQTNPADPIRRVDCREKDASPTAMFSPEFLDSLRPFGTIRFLDWQRINLNKGGNWAQRTQPTAVTHSANEGVAIEHMVALVKELKADAWIHIPYNADEEYITRMAQLVHDTLPRDQKVYVELSNEVWNYAFPVASQAQSEGLAQNLSPAPFKALMFRYSDKVRFAMGIWQRVFADRPGQLVRILGTQSANPWTAEQMLGWRDTPNFVDAVATAPYFGYNTNSNPNAPLPTTDELFLLLGQRADAILQTSKQTSAIAQRFGKRHVAYEAGQHMVAPNNVDYLRNANRHQKMYQLYDRYIRQWRADQNDLMILFNATHVVSQYGAWGLREYAGQPLNDTPKRRAALEAAARN